MYVAVKGGEKAIDHAHNLLARRRRGDTRQAALSVAQIREQMKLAVDRVMTEGSVYDPELAALAVKQASGDLMEAIFLLRAYRTTLPRLAVTSPVNTGDMLVQRRISATFKDVPGGQVLGSTYDYTHRLLDFKLLAEGEAESDVAERASSEEPAAADESVALCPRVLEMLNSEGLIEGAKPESEQPGDLTREPLDYPADRAIRLQALARGDEGFLLALAYSTQRGYGRNHPFAGEIRQGYVAVEIVPEELGFAIDIGDIELTECEMINQFVGSKDRAPQFTRGYGLGFGQCERKAMAMALVDRSLRAAEFDEERDSPAQNEEFVLSHCDNVESNGFVSHLKLPHYVDFQSELELLRKLRKEFEEHGSNRPAAKTNAATTATEVTS
ncbi:MAG: carbon-phosphorus lyase complex subunit PhnI [Alteromonadaceae bacterium]|nr:carbon-phosphorus lyase complex subunit PhnI [Alteromonadaceae bacterium]MBH83918.1 carbon-phosphorus lyase complex subunit PhnI [Alteromonadaceae bacterium]|tara:strand:- start:15654 stop:16808 length:1155 start_codon:yes stop_codon:yes gene_type:complete